MRHVHNIDADAAIITFGAPFVGNKDLHDILVRYNLHRFFHHYINQNDIVPKLLNLASTVTAACDGVANATATAVTHRQI